MYTKWFEILAIVLLQIIPMVISSIKVYSSVWPVSSMSVKFTVKESLWCTVKSIGTTTISARLVKVCGSFEIITVSVDL